MLRPTTLPKEKEKIAEKRIEEFSNISNQELKKLSNSVKDKKIYRAISKIVFDSSDMLPKRGSRPSIRLPYLANQLSGYHSENEYNLPLIRFSLLYMEYYDIIDDIIDEDYNPDYRREVIISSQIILPLMIEILDSLSGPTVQYWSNHLKRMVSSPVYELANNCTIDNYLSIVDYQAEMGGILCGLAVMDAGGTADAVTYGWELGSTYYKYEQFILDYIQYKNGQIENWNLCELTSLYEAERYMETTRSIFVDKLSQYGDHFSNCVKPLVYVDLDSI
jgi:hypothetical protein